MTFTVNQGVFTAQALLKSLGHNIHVDGAWGPRSKAAFMQTTKSDQKRVVDVVQVVNKESAAIVSSVDEPKAPSDFDRVVRAVVNEAKKRGLQNPLFYVAQIALETGWGRSTPRAGNGSESWNYGGLKANSVGSKASGSVSAQTSEVLNGKRTSIRDSFAVFRGPEHFAEVYFWYLFDSGSSYRYKGVEMARSASEFGRILQKNGYATDPSYSAKIASVASTAERRYSSFV